MYAGCGAVFALIFILVARRLTCTIKQSVLVKAAPTDVLWFLADFSTTAVWDPNVKSARKLSCRTTVEKPRPGDSFELVTIFKGRESAMEYMLAAVDPKALKLVLCGEGDKVTVRDTIALSPESGGTRVDYTLEVGLKGWRSIFVKLIRNDLEKLGSESLAGLVTAFANGSAKGNGSAKSAPTAAKSPAPAKRASKSPAPAARKRGS